MNDSSKYKIIASKSVKMTQKVKQEDKHILKQIKLCNKNIKELQKNRLTLFKNLADFENIKRNEKNKLGKIKIEKNKIEKNKREKNKREKNKREKNNREDINSYCMLNNLKCNIVSNIYTQNNIDCDIETNVIEIDDIETNEIEYNNTDVNYINVVNDKTEILQKITNKNICTNKNILTKLFIDSNYTKKILGFINISKKNKCIVNDAIQKYYQIKEYRKSSLFTILSTFIHFIETKNYEQKAKRLKFVYINKNMYDDTNNICLESNDNKNQDATENTPNNKESTSTKSSLSTTSSSFDEKRKSYDSPPSKKYKTSDHNESVKQKALKILENEIQNLKLELLKTKRYFTKPRPFFDFENDYVHNKRFCEGVKYINKNKYEELDILKAQIQDLNEFYVSAKNLPLFEILKKSRKTVCTDEWLFAIKEKKKVKQLNMYYKLKNRERSSGNKDNVDKLTNKESHIEANIDVNEKLMVNDSNVIKNERSYANSNFVVKKYGQYCFYLPEYIFVNVRVKDLLLRKCLVYELKLLYKNNCIAVDENIEYVTENVFCYKNNCDELAKLRKPKTQERFLEIFGCMSKKQSKYTYNIPIPKKGITNIHSSHLSVLGKVIPDIGRLQSPYAILEYKEKMKHKSYGKEYTRSINRI